MNLQDFYQMLREIELTRHSDSKLLDINYINDCLKKFQDELRIDLQHAKLFSNNINEIDEALNNVYGMAKSKSIIKLKEFIDLRKYESSCSSQIRRAKEIIEYIGNRDRPITIGL